MLHIVTPLFRYDLLEDVYRTIPAHDDITWHIAKTSRRPRLEQAFLRSDPRIRLYEVDCLDTDIVTKRNTMFDRVTDGYFFLLDDDTICLEEMYDVYREYSASNFVGMIVGRSNLRRAAMPSQDPEENRLDTGTVICHHSVLAEVRWEWSATHSRDWCFWSRCFVYFGPARTVVVNRTISKYNHFGPLIKVRKSIRSFRFEWDIHSLFLAKCYVLAADARQYCRRALRAGRTRPFGRPSVASPSSGLRPGRRSDSARR